MTAVPLKVGARIMVRGIPCTVYKVRPACTVDVLSDDGKQAFRVSGVRTVAP